MKVVYLIVFFIGFVGGLLYVIVGCMDVMVELFLLDDFVFLLDEEKVILF